MSDPLRVRALALHADYRCGRSGVCCRSGWAIPVEAETERRLRSALARGELRVSVGHRGVRPAGEALVPADGLPHGARTLLGTDAHGRCAFLEAGSPTLAERATSCAVHARLGEEALPSACRHFPRVARLTPRGVDLTLSHYCPTAARLLFRDLPVNGAPDPLLRIVLGPRAFPASWPYEGLDAREALAPFLRPGVLFGWQAHESWEAHAVAVLAEAGSPEAALDSLAAAAERIRAWTPGDGAFEAFLDRELVSAREAFSPQPPAPESEARGAEAVARRALEAWDEATLSLPAADLAARLPATEAAAGGRRGQTSDRTRPPADGALLVAAGWPQLHAPIRRWLAAKAFASWLALQGAGLRTTVAGLRLALGVLRAEAGRGCCEAGGALDAELLREAIRRADLLLVHRVDPDALARRLSRCEHARPGGVPGGSAC